MWLAYFLLLSNPLLLGHIFEPLSSPDWKINFLMALVFGIPAGLAMMPNLVLATMMVEFLYLTNIWFPKLR